MYTFDNFWNDYQKKVDPAGCKKLWNKLKPGEIVEIQNNVKVYVQAKPEKLYRLDPIRYLRRKAWNDEIISFVTEKVSLERKLDLPIAKIALQNAFAGHWDRFHANHAAILRCDRHAISRMKAEFAERAFNIAYQDVLKLVDAGVDVRPKERRPVIQIVPESPTEKWMRERQSISEIMKKGQLR